MPRPKSPLAGKTCKVKSGELTGYEITIEDWRENATGKSWMSSDFLSIPVAGALYTARVHRDKLPPDDEVLYGKIADIGYLVHVSELDCEQS